MEDSFYISLSSDACKEYYPSNEPWDFIVKLPSTLNLDNAAWVCGLCEIEFAPLSKTSKTLYVMMDVCQESIVNNQTLPLLRSLYIGSYKIINRPLSCTYNQIFYMPVKQQRVDRIHMYIKGPDDKSPSFGDKPLRCTLHFKRES